MAQVVPGHSGVRVFLPPPPALRQFVENRDGARLSVFLLGKDGSPVRGADGDHLGLETDPQRPLGPGGAEEGLDGLPHHGGGKRRGQVGLPTTRAYRSWSSVHHSSTDSAACVNRSVTVGWSYLQEISVRTVSPALNRISPRPGTRTV